MVKIIKLGEMNYFINNKTGEKMDNYDSLDSDLYLGSLTSSEYDHVQIPAKDIYIKRNNIYFNFKGCKYIVDDGKCDYLIRAGYFILNDGDKYIIEDRNIGFMYREAIFKTIFNAIVHRMAKYNFEEGFECTRTINKVTMIFKKEGYKFTIEFNTINSIVNRNQKRKKLNLGYYPYIKNMDKFSTIYLSMFCTNINSNSYGEKYDIADQFIEKLKEEIDNERQSNILKNDTIKYKPMIINRKVINY